MREMTATSTVRRGPAPIRAFAKDEQDFCALTFSAPGGTTDLRTFLEDSWTDGFLLLHKGKIITETYENNMAPHHLHLSMSVAKSVLGIVTGILVGKGMIDTLATASSYVPELEKTAYKDVTLQQILNMTSGVTFDESYETQGSHMQKLGNACAWGGREALPDWPETIWQLVMELTEQERPHGDLFLYRSIETDVLGFIVERVTGQSLADLLSDTLWQHLGMEEDAAYTVDNGGFALADGGLNATLRDYARFAQMILDAGKVEDRQIVPQSWIEETRFGSGGIFEGIYTEVLPNGGYHNKFWQVDRKRGVIAARGIYSQYIYLDPEASFAAVKLSARPTPLDREEDITTFAAFQALAQAVSTP